MKLRVLLVNPWIYDFAAADLWAKPLGLLKVAEFLSGFDLDLTLIDCTDAGRRKEYGKGKYPKVITEKPQCLGAMPRCYGRYGISIDDFAESLARSGPFDIVFMTSIMSYWYPGVRKAIEVIKNAFMDIPVVLGGIYATLCNGHAAATSGADFIHKGPAGDDMRLIFNTFGFRIRQSGRKRRYYDLGLCRQYPFAPVLTGVGCPFRCSYCASGLLSESFTRREPLEVAEEIAELRRRGAADFAFYDDALLADADRHMKVLLREIISRRIDARFHCPNGLHARFVDEEAAGLMKQAGFRTLRLGMETSDNARQSSTGGKVSSGDVERAVSVLKQQGFSKKEVGVYLMYGLPGQGFAEVIESVEFLKPLGVTIHLSEYSPVPGTEAWKELVTRGVVTEATDPLLTNNTVFSRLFAGYDPEEIDLLKRRVRESNSA